MINYPTLTFSKILSSQSHWLKACLEENYNILMALLMAPLKCQEAHSIWGTRRDYPTLCTTRSATSACTPHTYCNWSPATHTPEYTPPTGHLKHLRFQMLEHYQEVLLGGMEGGMKAHEHEQDLRSAPGM